MKIVFDRAKLLPFSLTFGIIFLDQFVKALIVRNWPNEGTFIADVFGNEFLMFFHVRNRAIAFSLGQNLPEGIKPVIFVVLPVIVLCLLLWYYITSTQFIGIQKWAVTGILGGGIGNIIDRIFRKDGVVDYVSVKFYGIFGWERWPTFNIADASVVVCCLILLATIIFTSGKEA